ncbi:MAG: CBS domain-containing protein [Candidatus Aenigmatarchaeota archaeon]
MEISKLYRDTIPFLTLQNTLKEAIVKILKYKRKLAIVDKKELIGAITDSDLLGFIITKKYGPNEKLKNIDYISFPIAINKRESVFKAIKLMKNYNLGSIIVTDEKNYPEYVLKDYELLDFVEVSGVAKDFMTPNPICAKLSSNTDLIKMLVFSKFRNLPVIDSKGKFKGLINVHRVLKILYLNNFKIPQGEIIQEVETFEEYDDIKAIKKYLKENEAAIVLKDDKVIGIITPYDIIKKFHE